jgi:hypothetical protein
MEMGIPRDGLDHILEVGYDQTRVAGGGEVAKVRTTSHMRPFALELHRLRAGTQGFAGFAFATRRRMIEAQPNINV